MKSIKIYSTIIIFIFISNFSNANTNNNGLQKHKGFKINFSFWKAKDISKYKYLAPLFSKEIPVEESITIILKNVFSLNEDNTKLTENNKNLAPEFPKEIAAEEEISISLDKESFDYKHLAPFFPNEIPAED